MAPERTSDTTFLPCAPVTGLRGGCAELGTERFGPADFPHSWGPRHPQPIAPRGSPATSPPPHRLTPRHTSTPTLRFCCPRGGFPPKVPGPPTRPVLTRRWHSLAEVAPGTRASRGGAGGRAGEGSEGRRRQGAPGAAEARLGVPGRPGRAGRRGGRAALTRCCCRVLTAAAAADAALCRSSAACPGRSRLRVNLRVRSTAIAGAPIRRGRSARPAGLPRANLLSRPTADQEAELGAVPPRFLAELARGGFFLSCNPTPHPLLSAEASRRLSKLRAPARRARPTGLAAPAWQRRLCRGRRGVHVGRLQPTLPAHAAGRPGLSPLPPARILPPLGRQRMGRTWSGRLGEAPRAGPPQGPWSPFGSFSQWSSGHFF